MKILEHIHQQLIFIIVQSQNYIDNTSTIINDNTINLNELTTKKPIRSKLHMKDKIPIFHKLKY